MPKISKDFLAHYLWRSEVDTYTERLSPVNFDVEVSYQNNLLYKFQASNSELNVPFPQEQKNDLKEVLDRSGLYELEVEFNPSSEPKIEINNGKIELPDETNIPAKIRSSDPSFKRWIQQICTLVGAKVYLIPDTNIIRRLYYTSYLRPLLISDTTQRISIKIPRLGVLEIENMYNRNKPSESSPPAAALQDKKDQYKESETRKRKERRLAFQSMGEILSMKNDGARILVLICL